MYNLNIRQQAKVLYILLNTKLCLHGKQKLCFIYYKLSCISKIVTDNIFVVIRQLNNIENLHRLMLNYS